MSYFSSIQTDSFKKFSFSFLIIGLLLPQSGEAIPQKRILGVKIYQFKGDSARLAGRWQRLGVTDAWVSLDLARDRELRRHLRQKKIRVWLISPVFYNPEALEKDPGLYAITGRGDRAIEDWVQFVCPSREEYRRRRISEIAGWMQECRPDGISLDFIRTFVFWEMVEPGSRLDPLDNTCFCPHCLQRMQRDLGFRIPDDLKNTQQKAEWVLVHHREEWIRWKCGLITSLAEEFSRELRRLHPGILINLHIVPWRLNDFSGAGRRVAAQDIPALSLHTDSLSPMCYSYMLKRAPVWISSVVRDLAEQTKKPIIPSIQVKEAYLPGPFSAEEFGRCFREALEPPSAGVVFWNWESLSESPAKQKFILLRRH